MAELRITNFTAYNLTEHEILEGSLLNYSQRCTFQNELANVSTQLSELTIDVTNPMEAVQQQAFLRGQQKLLQHFLETDKRAQEAINALNS